MKCVEKKRCQRQRSQTEKFNRPPCNCFLKGSCTKSPCEYRHLPECQFYRTKWGCKFGAACSFPHWKVEEQPNKKPKKDEGKSAVTIVKSVRQSSCVSQDTEPPDSVSISRKGTKVLGPVRRVRLTRAALRQANIREKEGPSQFYSPSEEWILPAASTINPEEREFVVYSGASMHMVSKKDLNKAEFETVRISKNPIMVVTTNGEVQTKEEATVYVLELEKFVTVMLLEGALAVL